MKKFYFKYRYHYYFKLNGFLEYVKQVNFQVHHYYLLNFYIVHFLKIVVSLFFIKLFKNKCFISYVPNLTLIDRL